MVEDKATSSSSSPHEAIFFVLTYLPLFELLTMTRVSKTLRDAINRDLLPWLKFLVIDGPLSRRLNDDILMEIASRANGKLQVLVLVGCLMVTDDGLLSVATQNPEIYKLHVSGCTSLSPEGVIKAAGVLAKNLKTLKINGIYNITKEHLQTLKTVINSNTRPNQSGLLYHEYSKSSLIVEQVDSPIDVDVCPKCEQVRMVFFCPPKEGLCNTKQQKGVNYECKACLMCIDRCVECGTCVSDEVEETLCGDTLCLQCWFHLPKCSFCNKPYCNQHARDNQQNDATCSTGFICSSCDSKYVSKIQLS